ncbi:hypothetical protein [Dawidia soli]|uniref:Small multi-drug export protein n=1 Tax=Dawidia soli TaxID=2782352 RepID=A0AAP2D7A8_9BACT|nr:hypothetical protein [Dawidia soli]MBT1686763.1 hypothetical protein [Dawidia soli]
MWESILKVIPIYFSSMFKFILGPVGGYAAGLTLMTTILVTVAGMMTVVLLFSFFGDFMRRQLLRIRTKRRLFSKRSRKIVVIWQKYGLLGVAILTPVFLTPIGGCVLAISFGTPKEKLIFYMFVSAAFWSVIFSSLIYFFGNEVLPDIIR